MKYNFRFLTLLLCFGILSGCVSARKPKYDVQIDSINSGISNGKKVYVLLPGNKNTSTDDLQFKEYVSYIDRAFSRIRLTKAEGGNAADIAIFLAYGITDPQTQQYTYSEPAWGVTGYSSSTTYGSLTSYGNTGTYSGTTYNTPQYGVTGETSHLGSYTTYSRWIILDAYYVTSYSNEKKMEPVWKTTITSIGSSGDLRRVFPILILHRRNILAQILAKN